MTKKTIKRTACWVLALFVALSLPACTNMAVAEHPTGTETAATPAADTAVPEIKPTAAPVKNDISCDERKEVNTDTVEDLPEPPCDETVPDVDETPASEETVPVTTTNQDEQTMEAPAAPPPETEPPVTEPPATQPAVVTATQETKPAAPEHQHSYLDTVVAPTCTAEGHTKHVCACGYAYTDSQVPATGHSFGEWVTTKEATVEAEGQQARICSTCGSTENQTIEKVKGEAIDTAALTSYGRSYAVNTYGYQLDTSMNRGTYCGYFPGYARYMPTMEAAYAEVRACIDDTTAALTASYGGVVKEIDGVLVGMRVNVEVEYTDENVYTVWVYYG